MNNNDSRSVWPGWICGPELWHCPDVVGWPARWDEVAELVLLSVVAYAAQLQVIIIMPVAEEVVA